jgi:hypothetical protein
MSRKRTPDQESPETPTAVAEPPAAEAKPDGQSFVNKLGERKRVLTPDPFGIAQDDLAGVRLFESKRDRQMAIKFEEKPSQRVLDLLKEGGYGWDPANRIWTHRVYPETARGTRIEAEWLFQEVRQIIREEKGIEPSPDLPS